VKTFKERVRNREYLCGTHISINDTCIAKIVGLLGFDYVWIDMEHSYLTYENLLNEIMVLQAMGTPVIVRAPQHDLTATKKIMEMGPDGIIFPMVRTKKEVEEVLSMTLYPPHGTRGFGPRNAVDYGLGDIDHYIHNNHKDMCRFIQIEHTNLIDELEEIVENPFLDGYIFGANDLSGSIGELTNTYGENTQKLIQKAISILNKHKKCIGLSTDDIAPEQLSFWHDLGIHMISAGSECGAMTGYFKQVRQTLKASHEQRK